MNCLVIKRRDNNNIAAVIYNTDTEQREYNAGYKSQLFHWLNDEIHKDPKSKVGGEWFGKAVGLANKQMENYFVEVIPLVNGDDVGQFF